MVNDFDQNKLRFLVIPSRNPAPEHKEDYRRAYACWREVWEAAFTKQSHIAVVFFENEVACFTLMLEAAESAHGVRLVKKVA